MILKLNHNLPKTTKLLALLYFLSAIMIWGQEETQHSRPNILFLVFDDAGLDLGVYGSSYVNTPGFDKIAKDGILFSNTYTPNAKCSPSRASILTGRNPWQLDAAANHVIYFPPKFKTYQEVLAEHGYATGYTGKGYAPGAALTSDGKPRQLLGPLFDAKTLEPPTPHISDNDYSGNFQDFLNSVPKGKPWSFWIGSLEPHRGYEYGSGAGLAKKTTDMIQDFPPYWPENEVVQNDMLDYAFEIESFDKHIQKVLQLLKKKGELQNTLIIVTSDHGMPFPRVKGDQYEKANHVPMTISWPEMMKVKGRKIEDFISFIDLAPTVLEAAGVEWNTSGMHPATGKSIMGIIRSEKSGAIEKWRDYVIVGKERHDVGRPKDQGYPIRGIYKDSMLYIRNFEVDRWPSGNPETGYLNSDGSPTKTQILEMRRKGISKKFWKLNFGKRPSEELYNIKKDPYCMNNLGQEENLISIKQQLKEKLYHHLKAQNDLRIQGYGHLYESYPLVKSSNFYEDYMNGKNPKAGWVSESDFEPFYLDDEGKNLKKVSIKKVKTEN